MSKYKIVCWKCKRGDTTLFRVISKEKGKHKKFKQKENTDYTCAEHRHLGEPPIGNVSRQRLLTKEDLAKAKKLKEKEADEQLEFLRQQKAEIEKNKNVTK